MLQGTLDVFSLDEVLGLLSSAGKSGVLNVTGDRGVGTVGISDGLLVSGSASSAPDVGELAYVVFELLRFEEGSFSFDGDATAEGSPEELEVVLADAHARLEEWRGIEAVVPTLDHHLSLAPSLTTSQVTLNESEWATVVAIGEGATVGVVANRLELGEFDGSKRVKGLVERSLATIDASAPAAPAEPASAPVAPSAIVEDVAPSSETPAFEAPTFETPAPAPTTLDMPVLESSPAEESTEVDDGPEMDDVVAAEPVAAPVPPMPAAPPTDPVGFDQESVDDEIPPMPEPPAHLHDEAAIAGEFAAPIEAEDLEALPAPDSAPSTFGGLDPIGSVDMFEPPQRFDDGSTGGFVVADDAPSTPDSAPESSEPTEEIPSLAPPAFDLAEFGVNSDDDTTTDPAPEGGAHDRDADVAMDPFAVPAASDDEPPADPTTGDDDDAKSDKGGSLLMRYLKSHG